MIGHVAARPAQSPVHLHMRMRSSVHLNARAHLAWYPGARGGGEKSAWYTLFAVAFNRRGIPRPLMYLRNTM